MISGRKLVFVAALVFTAGILFAAGINDSPGASLAPGHAPMEIFGIGPEMAADRGGAWIDALGALAEKAIAKIGVIAAAIILLRQNIANKKRLDNQRQDIDHLAAATGTPPGNLPSKSAAPVTPAPVTTAVSPLV